MQSEEPADEVLFFRQAMLPTGWAANVQVSMAGGWITGVQPDARPFTNDAYDAALPGMPNLHSHAFQRGMAGLAETSRSDGDSFWTWREIMYRFVDRIDPDDLSALAALAYIEMLEGGFTRVGEFHYLHHDRTGAPFSDPAEMSGAILAAAAETGIALTHLPVFYAHSGFGATPPNHQQRRFINSIDQFATLLDRIRISIKGLPGAVLGIAPHSLRAVAPDELAALQQLAPDGPIHIHIAEQVREVNDCLGWSGCRPVEWLMDNADVDARWCLVHATHMNPEETASVAARKAVAGICPITEANLGDGLFPATSFLGHGGIYGLGSDSNVLIDATEEMRLLEYGQRLVTQRRNVLGAPGASTGDTIYRSALAGGGQALGTDPAIAVGQPADFITLNMSHAAMSGRTGAAIADGLVFAAGRSAIDCVWRGGKRLVRGGVHLDRDAIVARYNRTISHLLS